MAVTISDDSAALVGALGDFLGVTPGLAVDTLERLEARRLPDDRGVATDATIQAVFHSWLTTNGDRELAEQRGERSALVAEVQDEIRRRTGRGPILRPVMRLATRIGRAVGIEP